MYQLFIRNTNTNNKEPMPSGYAMNPSQQTKIQNIFENVTKNLNIVTVETMLETTLVLQILVPPYSLLQWLTREFL